MKNFIKACQDFLVDIGKDKLLHFIAGYLIYFFSIMILTSTKVNHETVSWIGLLIVLVVAYIRDPLFIGSRSFKNPVRLQESVTDFIVTIVGAFPAFILFNYFIQ